MKKSNLQNIKFKKGKYTTPLNQVPLSDGCWISERLPEYLWIGLILDHYGRVNGTGRCAKIFIQLHKELDNDLPLLSTFLAMDNDKQFRIYNSIILENIDKKVLAPLTSICTFVEYPAFAKSFFISDYTIQERVKKIEGVLDKSINHQSHLSTDIRFLIVCFLLIAGKLHFCTEQLRERMNRCLNEYMKADHAHGEMEGMRSFIRSLELSIQGPCEEDKNDTHKLYTEKFWADISAMSECNMVAVRYENEDAQSTDIFVQKCERIIMYYSDLHQTSPLDNKMLVLLGIATYSYKRILELVKHDLFNEISGRGIIRNLIENCIMMKYLLKNETDRTDIWSEFQYYGLGQFKLIVEKYRDAGEPLPESHVDYDYIDALMNEYKTEDFINIDIRYFDKKSIREKADLVGEKSLYDLYYDYDSIFEHGLWGAIRQSSLLKCLASTHQHHCVPDVYDEQNLKSVWSDCKTVTIKIFDVLKQEYGLPEHLDTW